MKKSNIVKIIVKSLSIKNKIEVMKEKWRYIRPEDVPKYKQRGYVVERGPRGGWRVRVDSIGRPMKQETGAGKGKDSEWVNRAIRNFVRSAELFGVKDKIANELKDFISGDENKSRDAYFKIRQILREMKKAGYIDDKQYFHLTNSIRVAFKRKFGENPAKKKIEESKSKIKSPGKRVVVLRLKDSNGYSEFLVETDKTPEELARKIKYIASLFRQEGYEPTDTDIVSELEEREYLRMLDIGSKKPEEVVTVNSETGKVEIVSEKKPKEK